MPCDPLLQAPLLVNDGLENIPVQAFDCKFNSSQKMVRLVMEQISLYVVCRLLVRCELLFFRLTKTKDSY